MNHPSGSLYNHNSLTSSSSLGRFSLDFRSWGGSHLKGLKIRNVAMPLPVAPADVVWLKLMDVFFFLVVEDVVKVNWLRMHEYKATVNML